MKKIINSYALTHRRNALIILLILLMTLAAFFQNAATSKTSAATTIVSGSVYVLRNKCGDKALDVAGASSADRANVQQYTYAGNANQQWKIEATDSGYYKLSAQHSGKVLDISGAATTRGSNVQQYTYHGGVNQQWKITDAGDGYWKLSPRNASGQALDVSNSSTQNGANVQIWDDNGSCAQRWSLERIGGGGGSTPTPTTPTPVPPTPTPIPPTPTPVPPTPPSSSYSIVTSSFLGDSGNSDSVRGSAVLSDGTIVLAANIGNKNPSNVSPTLLNGATSSSGGAIIRLNPEGQVVLSVTRLANEVDDLAIDASDNIYVAAWNRGVIKLNSMANTLVWAKSVSGNVGRIDVGRDGTVAALATTASSPIADKQDGRVYVYSSSGSQISTFAGKNYTMDVCVDGASKTIITIGYRNANMPSSVPTPGWPNGRQPVQISYLQGSSYTGSVKYTDYDWSTDPSSSRYIDKSGLNLADTRGLRCAMGADGKLYAAFMAAGGNHIFIYSPTSITTRISIVGGDAFHNFYNTKSEHKTIFGRFDPSNGQLLLMQVLTNRVNGTANTIWTRRGAIAADASGQVYLGGECNSGLPMPPNYSPKTGEKAFNPFSGNNTGGAWLMVMSSDFKTRKFVTRLTTGKTGTDYPTSTNTIAVRTFSNGTRRIVFGGTTVFPGDTYVKNAIEITPNGGSQDGWFAVTGSN